ncbi:HAD family hydrolase [Selenomonas ruminantium]|uniref:HAD family hydrolase n=1 Tax=Selenomonas ruminantium TaxID=971 RepID=UPI0009E89F45
MNPPSCKFSCGWGIIYFMLIFHFACDIFSRNALLAYSCHFRRAADYDLDETLLYSAKQIPDETTAAIKQLMERGVEVVVGTGRGLAELADYRDAFQGMHYGLLGKRRSSDRCPLFS